MRRRWRAILGVGWVLACGAAVPVGACSKGCGACARSSDDVARVAAHGDDVARTGMRASDDLVRPALPVVEVAGRASHDGVRAFDDLGRAMDEIGVPERQYEQVMDAFDAAETALEAGLEAIDAGDPAGDIEERGQLVVEVSAKLEERLIPILGRDLEKLYAKVGRPEIFVARAKKRKLEERRSAR